MDFEEKIDAMRMTLELAMHDIEALRESSRELRIASEKQYESVRELRDVAAHQQETARELMKATETLLHTAQDHEGRIQGLERRA